MERARQKRRFPKQNPTLQSAREARVRRSARAASSGSVADRGGAAGAVALVGAEAVAVLALIIGGTRRAVGKRGAAGRRRCRAIAPRIAGALAAVAWLASARLGAAGAERPVALEVDAVAAAVVANAIDVIGTVVTVSDLTLERVLTAGEGEILSHRAVEVGARD